MTKTDEIKKLTCPFTKNSLQGNQQKILFVCSVGLLRSPTFADVATKFFGVNARSCGSDVVYALIPISANLIVWADKIVFMTVDNKLQTLNYFEEYLPIINQKSFILGIDDDYERNDPFLVDVAFKKLENLLN